MQRHIRTVGFILPALVLTLGGCSSTHHHHRAFGPSEYPHAVESYEGIHSSNSKPVSGRQMRMYRAGAALVPESEQHVLGLINQPGATGNNAPVDDGAQADTHKPQKIDKPTPLPDKSINDHNTNSGREDKGDHDPVYEAFKKWCDLDLQPTMTEEEWEIVRTHAMPEGMDCEMK
jgi:hypothetical protein